MDLEEEKDRKIHGQVGLQGPLESEKQVDGKWNFLDTMDDGPPKGKLDLDGEPVRRNYAKSSCAGRRVVELDRGHLLVKKADEAKDGRTGVMKPGKVRSSSEVGKDGSGGELIVADIRQQIEDAQRLAKERERKLAKERERIRQDNLLAKTTRKILTTLERKLKPGEEGEFEEFKRRVAHILPIEQASAGTGFGTNDKFRKTAEPARGFPYANKADDRVEAGKSIRGATLDNHYARWRKFANDWSDSSDGGTEVEQDMNPWQEHTGEWFDSPYPCKICGCPFWNAEGKFVCHC